MTASTQKSFARRPLYAGILLTARKGSRFDPSDRREKLLQRLPDGESVIGCAANALRSVVPLLAVVPPGASVLVAHLEAEGDYVTRCFGSAEGFVSCPAHGITHAADADGRIVALGNMPFPQPATIASLRDALANGAAIAVPALCRLRGNPVAFAKCRCNALLSPVGDVGARSLVQTTDVGEVAVSDTGIFRNIDTPEDIDGHWNHKELANA